jgi:hypothetical protein
MENNPVPQPQTPASTPPPSTTPDSIPITPPITPVSPTPQPIAATPLEAAVTPPQNSVWISKEEYERLRAIEEGNASYFPKPVSSETVAGSETPVLDYKRVNKFKDFWIYAGGTAAVLVFLGLTSDLGSFFGFPLMIALLIFGSMAVVSLYRAATGKGAQTVSSFQLYAPPKYNSAGKTVLTVLGIILLLPFLAIAGLIALVSILVAGSGGRGS